MEQRPKQAGHLFAAGKMIPAAIARELRVSRQSVSRWYAEWRRGGAVALRGAGRAGRKPKLNAQQLQHLASVLRRGARAHGFGTDLWTLPRVATVIGRLTRVQYHPGHVWKILGAMDWTLQRPAKQARERDLEKSAMVADREMAGSKKTLVEERLGSSFRTRAVSRNAPPSVEPGLP